MPGELRMLRLRFDAAKLHELGRRRRLPLRAEDLGYLLHCELKELFGAEAPGPFAVQGTPGRSVTVLAYSRRSEAELEDHARAFADPAVYAACDFRAMEGKVMPNGWMPGRRLGFQLRACPVVRLSKDLRLPSGDATIRAGAEVDAFLARCWRTEGPVDREAVYREWLTAEIERRGGARLVGMRMEAFQRERLVRRDQGPNRKAHLAERPDALMAGEIEVTDPERFTQLLARGVGRHRAFGFGMLLLRPTG